jgi:hypothetical protein
VLSNLSELGEEADRVSLIDRKGGYKSNLTMKCVLWSIAEMTNVIVQTCIKPDRYQARNHVVCGIFHNVVGVTCEEGGLGAVFIQALEEENRSWFDHGKH